MLEGNDTADTRWTQLNELYHAAMARQRRERGVFLWQACPDDDQLRREVESLLRYAGRELESAPGEALHGFLTERASSLAVGSTLGSLRIVGRLGAGGMGEVFRALDLKLQREVAIKIMPPNFAADADRSHRFAREAKVLASMNHPGIAAIYGLDESGETQALILELVEGPTLADRLAKGPLPLDEALTIAAQIIDAIEYAHDKGIIHRDLKPSNVKITPEGKVKVLDFGLAEGLNPDPAPLDDSGPGVILGTPAYMAPEQARGRPVDRRADIWSFGALLYEMLTARRAFEGSTVLDTLGRVISAEPDWNALPAQTPAGVRRLLELCLRKDPRARLRNIGDAFIVLESGSPQTPRRSPSSRRLGVIALAGIALVAVTAAVTRYWPTAPETPVVRLSIAPPDGVTLLTQAISPDGRRLAFTARDMDGVASLWVRELDKARAEKLPGTGGASYPFWSPDSRSIGFFDGERLKRIEAAGGPPQLVCAVEGARGGAWAPDGTILFSKASDGVYRVPAAGGQAQPLTKLEPARKEGGHYWPRLLPDGKRFVYTAFSARADARGVWVARLSHPADRRRLLDEQSQAVIASGHLLFVRDGLLTAQRFHPGALTLLGEPVPVVEGVTSSLGVSSGAAGFSASDTGVLVVGGGSTGAEPARLTWLDRSGRRLGTLGDIAPYLRLMLSPDRNRVVVDLPHSNRALDLFVIDPERPVNTRITFDPGFDTGPVWSPDGNRIAFASNRGGAYDLFLRQASGAGDDELLLHTETNKHPTDWSHDGRYILYVEHVEGQGANIGVVETSGARRAFPYIGTEFEEATARFSPDGQWVAYTSTESGRNQVYVQSFPPGASKWQISTEGGDRICWRPDGRELFYITPDHKLSAVEISGGHAFAAGAPRILFDTRLRNRGVSYDVSADGQRFLMPQPVQTPGGDPLTVILNWPSALRAH